jgi:hypothetical protein
MNKALVPYEAIEKRIYQIRDKRVMLDKDLAELYCVETKALNRQVNNNIDRFPDDFMFQLSKDEFNEILRCKNYTSSWGGSRYLPLAFTEQGVAMLSGVLRSKRAVYVNLAIMRAFIRLRQMIAGNQELAHKIEQLEKRVFKHDANIRELVRDIRRLTIEKSSKKLNVGFLK